MAPFAFNKIKPAQYVGCLEYTLMVGENLTQIDGRPSYSSRLEGHYLFSASYFYNKIY